MNKIIKIEHGFEYGYYKIKQILDNGSIKSYCIENGEFGFKLFLAQSKSCIGLKSSFEFPELDEQEVRDN